MKLNQWNYIHSTMKYPAMKRVTVLSTDKDMGFPCYDTDNDMSIWINNIHTVNTVTIKWVSWLRSATHLLVTIFIKGNFQFPLIVWMQIAFACFKKWCQSHDLLTCSPGYYHWPLTAPPLTYKKGALKGPLVIMLINFINISTYTIYVIVVTIYTNRTLNW